jgi:hypothetical protein
MGKRYCLLLLTACLLVLAACQKEKSNEDGMVNPGNGTGTPADTIPNNSDTTNKQVGTWKFISVAGKVSQTAGFTQAGSAIKGVTTSEFTSQNNGGTITFDSATMTANGITFSINTTGKTYVYMAGVLYDSLESPFTQTVSPQNATSPYKKIGSDSLYFQNGGLLTALTGGLLPSAPSGCKVVFEGNTMKMTIVYDAVTTQDYQGIPAKVTIHANLVATLQKQ